MPTRTTIVTLARTWLGTPYHHQASVKGVGCDCIGLIHGIWRELYGSEPEVTLPAYSPDWAEAQGRETLLDAARRHLVEIRPADAEPGDILIFRWRLNTPAKHCAILATASRPLPACGERAGVRGRNKWVAGRSRECPVRNATMIHALEGAGVAEVSLSAWWHRHLTGAFAFPMVSDPPGPTPSHHRVLH